MQKIIFIANKNSLDRHKLSIEEPIQRLLNSKIFSIDIRYTEYHGHAALLSKLAIDDGANIIVAVGGDGTVNEVAGPIIGTGVTFGVIPMGSGNGLARHMNISRNIEKSLSLISAQNTKLIDTCSINGKSFVSIAGVGFDAHVAELFDKGSRRGFFGYSRIVASEFLKYKSKKYHLIFDNGEEMSQRALFIVFANSNQFGYNITIAPEASLVDGLMDICIVNKPKIYNLPYIANLLLFRKIESSSLVKIIKAKKVVVTRKKKRVVNIDGEPIKFNKKLEVTINPLSLNIIINPNGSKV